MNPELYKKILQENATVSRKVDNEAKAKNPKHINCSTKKKRKKCFRMAELKV